MSKTGASSATKPAASANAPAVPAKPWILLDTATASEWNFQGCAISGPSLGKCLDRVPALKDYWFDWRNYHPETTDLQTLNLHWGLGRARLTAVPLPYQSCVFAGWT